MNFLDILIIIPLLWGGYKGFTKGFIIEVASLAALILGIYCAIRFSGFISDILINSAHMTSKYVPVISFVIIFIGIVVLVHLVARLADKLVKAASLGLPNRLLGAAFGAAKFLLIIGVVISVANRFDMDQKILTAKLKQDSLLYQPVSDLMEKIFPSINKIGNQALNSQEIKSVTEKN